MVTDNSPVRVDSWVWAVRLLKTRSKAADACKAGHIKVNAKAVKPSHLVVPGDRVSVWADHHFTDVEVTKTVKKRVGASIARTCYIDHSPQPPPRDLGIPRRDRGAGRPTKKERRQLDRLIGRDR
ncbi:RNA-binding S4 domain-containing protein [Corynebacterium sp. ES2794-CONJ1]|uniref:RNA-binding S4 domain-containing protein n=1 Tax=Corynebacterium sp. ES2794-CONJ1 TaxID=2980553 RepID=UPI0021DB2DDC|nr:RNA-binding S4 domain-containing protein [Corynebacterium sp. ES2794-CONJ1]MCU9518633.1 RNA-binding S4 domain-containing protein [Corynebacterium sp. ES2794-CONJ1]